MKLVMTLLARDEADIIGDNLSFHLEQGVDHAVVIDNGSIDGTRDILADYERGGAITVIDEPQQDYQQGVWMTKAALMARDELSADWVLNNDADEFWVARNGTLKDIIEETEADILSCRRLNFFFPWDHHSTGTWVERCVFRVAAPIKVPQLTNPLYDPLPCPYFYFDLPNKVLTKTEQLLEVKQGNHAANYGKSAIKEIGEIDILHFPVRSKSQFRLKISNGGAAYARNSILPSGMGWHWRRQFRILNEEGLEAALGDALPNYAQLVNDLSDGTVLEDRRMTEFLKDAKS